MAIGVACPQEPLELALARLPLCQLDLADQPVESKSNRWIADAVEGGSCLERARGQEEPLEESQILVSEATLVEVQDLVQSTLVESLELHGVGRPTQIYEIDAGAEISP